jgi:cell wall-associated NlpC family hydrolase
MTREQVVAEAMTWLRTPYHHRGALKGIGVDCAQFPLRVYASCGLIEPFEPGDYATDWHLHRSEERYLNLVTMRAREIDPADVQPGDFVLFRVGRCFSHGAIVVSWPRIIHAVIDLCVTLDEATNGKLAGRPIKAFTLWSSDGSALPQTVTSLA